METKSNAAEAVQEFKHEQIQPKNTMKVTQCGPQKTEHRDRRSLTSSSQLAGRGGSVLQSEQSGSEASPLV